MSLSDLFSRFVEFLGKEAGPAEALADDAAPPRKDKTGPSTNRYAPIRDAVESKLVHLVRHEIPVHREIAGDDSLELHCVEIEAAPEGQALLDEFFIEFNPAARQQWVRTFLGPTAAVKLDCFAGVYRNTDLPPTPDLDQHAQILNLGVPATYRVCVWSKWVQAAPPPPPTLRPGPSARGSAVVLRIHDGQGPRPDIRRENYPVKIGRQGEVAVDGTYASADHCTLHWQGGQVELEDHSKNGTWIDGAKLHGQRKPLSLGKHQIKLGKAQGEAKDSPEIELEILAETTTPIAGPTPAVTHMPTPVASDRQSLLAVLSIQDASGNPHIDVLRLPFSIGRGSDRDYVAPPAHAGVSGLHLVIEALGVQGAEVSNPAHAKNGIAMGGSLQGGRFLWPFGEEITLAPQWKHDKPVRITLKRTG